MNHITTAVKETEEEIETLLQGCRFKDGSWIRNPMFEKTQSFLSSATIKVLESVLSEVGEDEFDGSILPLSARTN